ncbi:MAG: hypothetical protein DWQ04_17215 [Chloroflexi bacterium]|nr:MAG: hypothetical protein DWQ04_17215 [Chloroflexota bacterium]
MNIRDRIQALSVLPSRYNIMMEQALLAVMDAKMRKDLCIVACVVANATWQHWQAWRLPADNRQEHEWIVFANVMKIAESEQLSLTERRIATAFCFTHDSYFIERVMEEEIRALEKKGHINEADELTRMKKNQRMDHMKGGAENARFLLKQLKKPDSPTNSLFSVEEIYRCAAIVAQHDLWKVEPPVPPPTNDRLALTCVEGDMLWPLHPIGVLADLDRPGNDGESKDMFESSIWREQLKQSHQTLLDFRAKWKDISDSDFIDGQSIFRTKEGHRLYSEWKGFWNL